MASAEVMNPETTPALQENPVLNTDAAQDSSSEPVSQPSVISSGYLHKRGPRPRYKKRYFVAPSNARRNYPLSQLKAVYRKNAKKLQAFGKEFEQANKYLLDTIATATVNAAYTISYFASEEASNKPLGLINLKHIKSVYLSPKIKANSFVVKTLPRDYVLCATSEEEAKAWVETINQALKVGVPDYSDTQAYKETYNQLLSGKAFSKHTVASTVTSDDEVFSASEAEFEPENSRSIPENQAQNSTCDPTVESSQEPETKAEGAPETPAADASTNEVSESNPNQSKDATMTSKHKSYYHDVMSFLTKRFDKPVDKENQTINVEEPPVENSDANATPKEQENNPPANEHDASVNPVEAKEIPAETSVSHENSSEVPPPAVEESGPNARHKGFGIPKLFHMNDKESHFFSKIFAKKHPDYPNSKETATSETANNEPVIADSEQPTEKAPEMNKEDSVATDEKKPEPPKEEPQESVGNEAAPPQKQEIKPSTVENSHLSNDQAAEDSTPAPAVLSRSPEAPKPLDEPTTEISDVPPSQIVPNDTIAVEPEVKSEPSEKPAPDTTLANEPSGEEEQNQSAEVEAPVETEKAAQASGSEHQESAMHRTFTMLMKSFKHDKGAKSPETRSPVQGAESLPAVESPKPEPPQEPIEVQNVLSEEPQADEPTESTSEPKAEDTADVEKPATPQKKHSLFQRIGGFAMGAVMSPALPNEEADKIVEGSPLADIMEKSLVNGYLLKQTFLFKTFEPRFFALSPEGTLYYHRFKHDEKEGKKIELKDSVEIKRSGDKATGGLFEIVTKLRTFRLCVKDETEREQWIEQLVKFAKLVEPSKNEAPTPVPANSAEPTTTDETKQDEAAAPTEEITITAAADADAPEASNEETTTSK